MAGGNYKLLLGGWVPDLLAKAISAFAFAGNSLKLVLTLTRPSSNVRYISISIINSKT